MTPDEASSLTAAHERECADFADEAPAIGTVTSPVNLTDDAPRAIPSTLDTFQNHHGETVRLEHAPEGWAVAGSMVRYAAERWSVLTRVGSANYGTRYATENDAREAFEQYRAASAERAETSLYA